MNKFSSLFSKNWRNVQFISIFILLIVLTLADKQVAPYINQAFLKVFYSPFSYVKESVLNLKAVSAENDRLNIALADVSLKLSLYLESAKENDRLRSVLGFKENDSYELLPAEIVSVSGDFIPVSAVINRGYDDSVYIDQPVINQAGLIGRVSSVSQTYAVVELLTDPSNRVAARINSSREMGIIKYFASTGMILDNFPVQGEVYVGDTVISSGLGGVYPEGLIVGTVADVQRQELAVFCDIKITPAANFYSLDELFLLKEVAP